MYEIDEIMITSQRLQMITKGHLLED